MTPPGPAVEVRTGARLHFGLFGTYAPDGGRLGGIGMMIDRPELVLRGGLCHGDRDVLTGPAAAKARVTEFLARFREALPEISVSRYAVEIENDIPPHHGFGSGTQSALAVAAMLTKIHCYTPYIPFEPLGRSGRSAVGGSGFFRGGFVFDPGRGRPTRSISWIADDLHYPGVVHRPVPEDWKLVAIDPVIASGVFGTDESEAFSGLPEMSAETEDRLRRLAKTVALPALESADFEDFASSVSLFNRIVGEHFAPAQGGTYAHPLIRELSRTLADTDWPHLAQSSWGPAAAVFCESEASAAALEAFLRTLISPAEADVFTAAPLNRGATVRVVERP